MTWSNKASEKHHKGDSWPFFWGGERPTLGEEKEILLRRTRNVTVNGKTYTNALPLNGKK